MSLTTNDLDQIRSVVESALAKQTEESIKPIQGEMEAIRNDIAEIYDMITDLQKGSPSDKTFQKLSIEKKLLRLHAELVEAAKQAGVTLPSH
jgi:Skp family chaperone for outer membrane proteins